MQKISFPFRREESVLFGTIDRPVAEVGLWSSKRGGWIKVVTIVDTGADYSLLPHYFALSLGVDLKRDCQIYPTSGIGGTEQVFLLKKMLIKIGRWQSEIPIGFLKRDDVPPLLGRKKCLEEMGVLFYRKKTTFIFDR